MAARAGVARLRVSRDALRERRSNPSPRHKSAIAREGSFARRSRLPERYRAGRKARLGRLLRWVQCLGRPEAQGGGPDIHTRVEGRSGADPGDVRRHPSNRGVMKEFRPGPKPRSLVEAQGSELWRVPDRNPRSASRQGMATRQLRQQRASGTFGGYAPR